MTLRIVAIFTVIIVVASIFLGFWYLLHPEIWNWRFIDGTERSGSVNFPGNEETGSAGQNSLTGELAGVASSIDHLTSERPIGNACIKTPSGPLALATRNSIYRWIDENGVISFSDRPPSSGDYELVNSGLPARMDYFQLDVDFRNQTVIPFFQRRVSANVTAIYVILSRLVSDEYLRKVELNVVVLPNRANYLDYSSRVTGERLSNSGGFYSSGRNEAVTYRYDNDNDTLAVTQHESLHVIMHGIFGIAPAWLNEGLAEYFEQLSVTGQVTRVETNADWLGLARNALGTGYPARLGEFLNLPLEEWYASNQDFNYALSWSLVYFLMNSREGNIALTSLLEELAINYCDSIDSYILIARSYPGGFSRFEQDFRYWLSSNGIKNAHIY